MTTFSFGQWTVNRQTKIKYLPPAAVETTSNTFFYISKRFHLDWFFSPADISQGLQTLEDLNVYTSCLKEGFLSTEKCLHSDERVKCQTPSWHIAWTKREKPCAPVQRVQIRLRFTQKVFISPEAAILEEDADYSRRTRSRWCEFCFVF